MTARTEAWTEFADAAESGGRRIGEVAAELGVTADTIRFYEKEGWLPRPRRGVNSYRAYSPDDVEHIRLLLGLRHLDLPLADASRLATWCHSGHCAESTQSLPLLVAEQRRIVAERMARLAAVDEHLERLERHLRRRARSSLPMLDATAEPCCDVAVAVGAEATGCSCAGGS